jgi:hypothetical protein
MIPVLVHSISFQATQFNFLIKRNEVVCFRIGKMMRVYTSVDRFIKLLS